MVVPRNKKIERRKKLPNYWQRVSRTEEQRHPERERIDSKSVKNKRNYDRKGTWGFFGKNLNEIGTHLGYNMLGIITRKIAKHKGKMPFSVLDLGCGPGIALLELKKTFGKKIRTVGLALEKTSNEKYSGVDRLMIGNMPYVKPRETFDFIYSHSGAVYHSESKTKMIQRSIEWLKPGGTAIIELGDLYYDFRGFRSERLNEIRTVLAQNGIKKSKTTIPGGTPYTILFFEKSFSKLP